MLLNGDKGSLLALLFCLSFDLLKIHLNTPMQTLVYHPMQIQSIMLQVQPATLWMLFAVEKGG